MISSMVRPQLHLPQDFCRYSRRPPINNELVVINLFHKCEATISNLHQSLDAELKILEPKQLELEKNRTALRQKVSDLNNSKKSWGTVAMVAQYVSAVATTALGIAAIATGAGTPAGVLLVASGVIGLTGRILHDTGSLQKLASWMSDSKEMQKRIVRNIDIGFFVASLALGLSSCAFTSSFQIFTTLLQTEKMRKVILGVTYGSWIAKGGIDLRLAFLKNNQSEVEALFKDLETERTQLSSQREKLAEELRKTTTSLQEIRKEIQATLQASA